MLAEDPTEDVTVRFTEQPANSPDMNILDLGFFRALEARTHGLKAARTLDELIDNVGKAFDDYEPRLLNRIWLTHASVFNRVIADEGGNNFDIPHMKKDALEKEGALPIQIDLSHDATLAYHEYVSDN